MNLQGMLNEVHVSKEVVALATSYQTEVGVRTIVNDEAPSCHPVAGRGLRPEQRPRARPERERKG